MKIIHLIQRYAPAIGGSETWCREVARRQARLGHQVRVLTLDIVTEQEFWAESAGSGKRFRLGHLDLMEGVEVRRFHRSLPVPTLHRILCAINRRLGILFLGPHSREMVAHLDVEFAWADLVHLHTMPYPHNWFGLRAARRVGRPVVLTPHFHPDHPEYERSHQYRWMRKADLVLADSEQEKVDLVRRGVAADRIQVAGIGLPDGPSHPPDRPAARRRWRQALGLAEEAAIVVCIARKHPVKGLKALVGAVGRLADQGRAIGLVLAGPSFDWFETLLASLPPRHRRLILDRGVVTDQEKAELLAGADLFAMPSRFEAFGIVFLEAWNAGLPVIGGNRGAQPSVIGAGGRVVPFDDEEATASAIASLLDDPEDARRAVAWGQRAIRERYNWERITGTVLQGYGRLVPAGRLRILYGSNFYPPDIQGGAEIALAQQARGLLARGHQIEVLAGRLDPSLPRHAASVERGGEIVHRLVLHPEDLSTDFPNHVNPAAARLFRRLLLRVAPDVVHFHNLAGLSIQMIHAAANRGLPVVMTLHDYWGICVRNTLVRSDGSPCDGPGLACAVCVPPRNHALPWSTSMRNTRLAEALSRVSLFLSPSRYLAGRYVSAGLPRERIRHLPYGVDLTRFHPERPIPWNAPFIYVGYLGSHKGLFVLLEALSRTGKDVHLRLAGDGHARGPLEKRARELGLTGRVKFLGKIPNESVPELLAECRALVLPSVWPENAPVTIVEAMAAARPVVATRTGGIPELVADRRTAYLVPPNDPGELASALSHLARDRGECTRLGKEGRHGAQRFDLVQVLERLEEIYRSLTKSAPARALPWNRRVVSLAGETAHSRVEEVFKTLLRAESRSGPFHLASWPRQRPGDAAPSVRGEAPEVVLLLDAGDTQAAREAISRQIPFLALAARGTAMERLALRSGGGSVCPHLDALGDTLARLLMEGPEAAGIHPSAGVRRSAGPGPWEAASGSRPLP